MKRLLFILLFISFFVSFSISAFSQDVRKREELGGNVIKGEYLVANWGSDENGNFVNPTINLITQNLKYKHITDIKTIYRDSPKSLYSFLTKIESFIDKYAKDGGISTTFEDIRISSNEKGAAKGITIWFDGGYQDYNKSSIVSIKKRLVKWCEKNNIEYSE